MKTFLAKKRNIFLPEIVPRSGCPYLSLLIYFYLVSFKFFCSSPISFWWLLT